MAVGGDAGHSAKAALHEHLRRGLTEALERAPAEDRPKVYVLSLYVEDYPPYAKAMVGYNTEEQMEASLPSASGEPEARWNFAFWLQNDLGQLCEPGTDDVGAQLAERWMREELGLTDPEEEDEAITRAFVGMLVEVVRDIHAAGAVESRFGRPIPVIIHQLEYDDETADRNLAANPVGVVPDSFVSWCRGG